MTRKLIKKVWTKAVATLIVGGSMFAVASNGCSGNVSGFPFSIGPGMDNNVEEVQTLPASTFTPESLSGLGGFFTYGTW